MLCNSRFVFMWIGWITTSSQQATTALLLLLPLLEDGLIMGQHEAEVTRLF